jgi:Fe-S-cluster-containing hydrogenase components 1
MTVQLGMVVDASACIDCKACMASCKVANQVPTGYWRNWIKEDSGEAEAALARPMIFQPGGCMQCGKPTCVEACPTGATYKSEKDGVVYIDRGLCIGCGQCIPACPYGARFRHPALKVADKCDFCTERRAQGLEPACVSTCPTKARVFGDLNDPKSEAHKLLKSGRAVQVVNHMSNTDPNMYYLGDPGPYDWPVVAKLPATLDYWRSLAGPAMKIIVGLSGLGVAAMIGKQLFVHDDKPIGHDGEEKGVGHE